jgi:hypothetical protein
MHQIFSLLLYQIVHKIIVVAPFRHKMLTNSEISCCLSLKLIQHFCTLSQLRLIQLLWKKSREAPLGVQTMMTLCRLYISSSILLYSTVTTTGAITLLFTATLSESRTRVHHISSFLIALLACIMFNAKQGTGYLWLVLHLLRKESDGVYVQRRVHFLLLLESNFLLHFSCQSRAQAWYDRLYYCAVDLAEIFGNEIRIYCVA